MSLISLFATEPKPHLHRVRGQWYARSGSNVRADLHWQAVEWCCKHSELTEEGAAVVREYDKFRESHC